MANISTISKIILATMKTNQTLVERGLDKVVLNIEGPAGIGKTSIIEQIAQNNGFNYVKVSLSQMEELGDLVGVPKVEVKAQSPEGKIVWIPEKQLAVYIAKGYKTSSDSRMTYSIPAWVPKDDTPTIVNLDDFTRANPLFMQAIMEIIAKGEYVSWKLPKNTQLLLTSNPDDQDYNVSMLDQAQKSRYITLKMDFDINAFAEWAEGKLSPTMINFALYTKELFKDKNGKINARNYTMFSNAISSYDINNDFDIITTIANGTFQDDGTLSTQLYAFCNGALSKIIEPKDIVNLKWEALIPKLEENIYPNGEYRADIASVISTRFVNYVKVYFTEENGKSEKIIEKIINFAESEKQYITEDLLYYIINNLVNNFKTRCSKLLFNPVIRKKLVQ